MNKEKWYDINGYNDYKVSNLGNVKSVKCGREMILKPFILNNHYFVSLSDNNKKTDVKIAVLVFKNIMNIHLERYFIMYRDGDPSNCSVDNIYTIHYSYRSRKKLDRETVINIYNAVKTAKVKDVAKAFDVSQSVVSNIRNKKSYKDITDYVDLEDKMKNGYVPQIFRY